MTVLWPDRRTDVLNGLEVLAAEPVLDRQGCDPRWPDLTNAIHWVVDDTGWDSTNPAESVGTLLMDSAEAEALAAVATLLVAVSQRVGAAADDATWCSDLAWPEVRSAAKRAATMLRGNDG